MLELSAASVAVQVTSVGPTWKVDPEAGLQTMLTVPGELSLTWTVKVTTAEHWPASVPFITLDGHWIVGGVVSLMVTALVVMLLAESLLATLVTARSACATIALGFTETLTSALPSRLAKAFRDAPGNVDAPLFAPPQSDARARWPP